MSGEGNLRIDWVYSENFHQRSSVEKLANRYLERLDGLIAHCLSDGAGGHTPADFPLAGFDDAKLGKLASLLAKKDQG